MTIVIGFGAFVVAFLVHVIWWRSFFVKNTGVVLIAVLSVSIGVVIFGYLAASLWLALPRNPIALLQATTLAFALAVAYVMTYPAVEVPSPTLVIIDIIARAGSPGIERSALNRTLDDDFLVMARVDDMVNERYVRFANGRYELTPKGRSMARFFVKWRSFLRLEKGG